MYINQLSIRRLRSIGALKANFAFDGQRYDAPSGMTAPRLTNVNLVLGDNGVGKSSLLQAVALAVLGPEAGTVPKRPMVRIEPGQSVARSWAAVAQVAEIDAVFTPTDPRTRETPYAVETSLRVLRDAGGEQLQWPGGRIKTGEVAAPYFAVGYGARRRVADVAARGKSTIQPAARFASLLGDNATLVALETWLPGLQRSAKRFQEIKALLDRLLAPLSCHFIGRRDRQGAYLFEGQDQLALPLASLSEAHRGFIAWVADLLYHLYMSCPRGGALSEQPGIALIDEVDLHLHPSAQMQLVPALAAALPRVQFILTSHSPLLAGSLDIANILILRRAGDTVEAVRINRPVYGLDADQLLVSDLFGLASTRADGQRELLKRLATKARAGDTQAALRFLDALAPGQTHGAR